MEKIVVKKEIWNVFITLIAAILHAVGLWVFVIPAAFAPSEIAGISTMLYEITGLNAGYYSLFFNVPLLVAAWFLLKKRYVVYALLFTVLSSALMVVFEEVAFYQYTVEADRLLAAIFSGVFFGFRTGIMLKIGSSTGGSDIIAGIIQTKKPYMNVEKIIMIIGYAIALSSYFLYWDLNCILLSLVQTFVLERIAAFILKDSRNAIEVKVVTQRPEELRDDILHTLRHSATILESEGMYSEQKTYMVVSVLNTHQLPELNKVLKKYPKAFVYYSDVAGVRGNFRWRRDEEVK